MTRTRIRKINENNINKGTIDQKHSEILKHFEKLKISLPSKKSKLQQLQREFNDIINMDPEKYTHEDIRRRSILRDSIQNLKNEIESIENCKESLDYISNTLPILIDYYNNNEVSDDNTEEFMDEKMITNTNTNNNTINNVTKNKKKNIINYFMKENERKKENVNNDRKKYQNDGNINSYSTRKINRAKLYDRYLSAIDSNRKKGRNVSNQYICSWKGCGGELVINQTDGCIVCTKCGLSEPIVVAVDNFNYREQIQDSGTYAYKRINHLTEILSQLQAKESTDIPQKVFDAIKRELKKRKINKDDLDIFKLRRVLKKLNYRKYYEHVPYILQIINGKQPPNFSRKDEMKIKMMFKAIQEPFAIYCPKNRKNFLSYSYVLHKFCELLDLDEYIDYFPLLKNNTKLLQHDKIWKNICKYMKWKFYKSM